jgi:hypothetical protein
MSDFYGANLEFEDFDRLLKKDDLIEEPAPPQVFLQDSRFLNQPLLSEKQFEIMRHITQIFKVHTLVQLYGEEKGLEYHEKYTVNEAICQLGKGSGKDHTSRISMAYVVYLLHCLRDPLEYYNKAPNVYIDLINLAVNAKQAQQVFFEPFKNLLLTSPYFEEKGFEPRVQEVLFWERPIRCFSGHSESESWEGFDPMLVVLDEISAFKTDAEVQNKESRNANTASGIYNMAKLSVSSRFPKEGTAVLLSFPRYKDDFIQQRYNQYLELRPPRTWGMKASTWDVNPTISREDLEAEFIRNPIEAEARFNCNPPEMEDAFFRDPETVRKAFSYNEQIPYDSEGRWEPWFNGSDGRTRFIHVDLGLNRDAAALGMVHASGFKEVKTLNGIETLPVINMDLIKTWKADFGHEINFASIRSMIIELCRKFDVAKVTFDMWQSIDMIQGLNQEGINSEWHTVSKKDYDTLSTCFYDGRFKGYYEKHLVEEELLKLRLITNTKVDHPNKGSKDQADAVAGATYQCLQHLPMATPVDIEIWTDSLETEELEDNLEKIKDQIMPKEEEERPQHTPEREMPDDLKDFLMEML